MGLSDKKIFYFFITKLAIINQLNFLGKWESYIQ
jgi:hypothetical protein